jgi:hypothetical protein
MRSGPSFSHVSTICQCRPLACSEEGPRPRNRALTMTCKVKIGVFGDDFSPQCEGGGGGGEDKRTSGQAEWTLAAAWRNPVPGGGGGGGGGGGKPEARSQYNISHPRPATSDKSTRDRLTCLNNPNTTLTYLNPSTQPGCPAVMSGSSLEMVVVVWVEHRRHGRGTPWSRLQALKYLSYCGAAASEDERTPAHTRCSR